MCEVILGIVTRDHESKKTSQSKTEIIKMKRYSHCDDFFIRKTLGLI